MRRIRTPCPSSRLMTSRPSRWKSFEMHTVEHLRQLFSYNDWANRRTIVALKSAQSERSRQILAHLLTTEREYFERLHGKDSAGFDFWRSEERRVGKEGRARSGR